MKATVKTIAFARGLLVGALFAVAIVATPFQAGALEA